MLKKLMESKAFTLIEVLVAMLVLAIGLLGLAGITVVVLKSNILSQQMSEATNIATALMEDLRRTSNLPNCVSANALSVSPSSTTCNPLVQSGIAKLAGPDDLATTFLPASINKEATCGVAGILGNSSDAVTYDAVAANYFQRTDFSVTANLCSATPPAGRPYIRYYRTMQPGAIATEVRIIVVVLWQDKYGKYRHVKLETTRATN